MFAFLPRALASLMMLGLVASCGDSGYFGPSEGQIEAQQRAEEERETIWDLFDNNLDPNTTVAVNKYIWNASLEVLDFLPVQTVDPFTGVIVTGFGTAPGSGRAYRATVYVNDPALDARSLRVALATRSGPADPDTVLAVEDAILTRARQLRLADSNL
ncbi:MAG: DUF3576 domain-containing protein [Pseudomonadota bacterium]